MNLGYETFSLYKEAKFLYDEILLINPRKLSFKLVKDSEVVSIDGRVIKDINTLIVRATGGCEQSISLFVNFIYSRGCDIIDPLSRFVGAKPTKTLPALAFHEKGVGINSYLVFDIENGHRLISELDRQEGFPLLAKPINGSKGKGVEILPDKVSASKYLYRFYENNNNQDYPLLLQDYMDFVSEYRVIVIMDYILGVVRKIPKPGSTVANAAQGGTFTIENAPHIAEFVLRNVDVQGILGVDVGEDIKGECKIIEVNYSPAWRAFEAATGINVARKIVERCFSRLNT